MTELHSDALRSLREWTAPDVVQEELRRDYVRHLETHADGMRRTCHPDHITAGAVILTPDGSHVLLTLHAKAGEWFHMGGHCEPGDVTLAGAALREAQEESGVLGLVIDPVPVHLDRHEVAFCGDRGGVRHLDVRYLAVASETAEHAVSEESLDVRWWPVHELPGTADLPALVDAAARRLRSTPPVRSQPAG